MRDKIALAAATADWVGLDCQASCFSVLMVKRILSQSDHPRAPIMFAVAISIVPLCSVVKMLQVLRCPRSAILDQESLMITDEFLCQTPRCIDRIRCQVTQGGPASAESLERPTLV